ncbi:MAG: prolyl oligopeptidase family serine peptidase [Candidatus Aenigmarchaeota archaeon]|nr:prolyl oligopeptidase family serine peptidase [Candidatus Aenigmarchaeota archaeon]
MDKKGITYELSIFRDEGHGILKTKNQKILFRKIANFFAKALE